MANVVGSATIRIIPDTSGFSAALRGQLNTLTSQVGAMGGRNITGNLSTQLNTLGTSLDRTGTRAALVGQAFTYGLTRPLIRAGEAIIGVAADFDEAARTVAAVTIPDPIEGVFESMDMFEGRVQQYKDSAREMARETVFSSTEVEKAYVDLARAGLTSADQLESVIGTVANVALVEGGSMADFSDKLVQIFTGFGGNFEEVGEQYETIFGDVRATTADLTAEFEHMGDILALTSQRTVTDITDLAVAFRYAGPTAKAAGLSFEETAAGLGLLAQAGFSASMGGTALRGIITRLAIPTKLSEEIFEKFGMTMEQAFQPENAARLQDTLHSMGVAQEEIDEIMAGGAQGFREAQDAIAEYGFEVFDAAGNMRPLVDIVEEFVDKGARVGDISKVFGQRAGPAFQGLMDNLPALQRLTVELDGAEGALDRMAERMKTSASVQFKLLKNSLIELAIAFGESGVLKFFSDLAADLRDFALGLADTNPQILKIVGAVAALVAAIGPVGLVFGLWTQGLGKFIQFLGFVVSGPIGAFVAAMTVIGATIGFLISRSEALGTAFGALFDSIMTVVGPIAEQFGRFIAGVVGGIGKLAEMLGNYLAPAVADTADKINDWVEGGGLFKFLSDSINWVGDLANKVFDLWQQFKLAGGLETVENGLSAVREAADRLVAIFIDLWDASQPIFTNLLPALRDVGSALATTVGAAFVVAWNAASGFLSAIELLVDVLKPVLGFLGDNLTNVLQILVMWFLRTRSSIDQAVIGFGRLGQAADRSLGMFGNFFGGAAQRVDGFTLRVSDAVARVSVALTTMSASASVAAGRFSAAIFRMGDRAGSILRGLSRGFQTFANVTKNVMANSSAILSGFFAGQMAAQATTFKDKIVSLGTVFVSMATSIAMLPGPAGLALAVLTGIAAIMGNLLGKAEEWDALTFDMGGSIRTLSAEFEKMGTTDMPIGQTLDAFNDQLEGMDPRNVAIMKNNIEELGFSMTDLGEAFMGGEEEVAKFVDTLGQTFADQVMAGTIESERFGITVRRSFGMGDRGPEEYATAWGDIATEIGKAGDELFYVTVNGEKVGEGFTDAAGAATRLKEIFDKDFLGQAVRDFGTAIDAARDKFDATRTIQRLVMAEQTDLNERAKGWSTRIEEANSGLDRARSKIANLFKGPDDPAEATARLFESIDQSIASLMIDGNLMLTPPDPTSPQAGAWYDSMEQITGNAQQVLAGIALEIPPVAPPEIKRAEFERRFGEMRAIYMSALQRPVAEGGRGMTQTQANEFLNTIMPMPSEEQITAWLGDQDIVAAQIPDLARIFNLPASGERIDAFVNIQSMITGPLDPNAQGDLASVLRTGNIDVLARINLALEEGVGLPAGMTSATLANLLATGQLGISQYDAFINVWPSVNGLESLSEQQRSIITAAFARGNVTDTQQINSYLSVFQNPLPPGLTYDMLTALLGFDVIEPKQLTAYVNLLGGALPTGWNAEKINQLLTTGNMSLGQVEVFLRVIPEIPVIAGLDPAQVQDLVQKMAGSGATQQQINATLNIISGDPAKFAEIQSILNAGLNPVKIPVYFDVQNANPNMTPQQIVELINFAAGFNFAEGGIVTSETFARIGEDGPEVVIPLTKPDRAASLMADSGLYQFAFKTAMAGGVPPGIINIANATPYSGFVIDPNALPAPAAVGGGGPVSMTLPGATVSGAVPPVTDVLVNVVLVLVGAELVLATFSAIVNSALAMAGTIGSAFAIMNIQTIESLQGVMGTLLQIISITPALLEMVATIGAGFTSMAFVVVTAITAIVQALSLIPIVMASVGESIARGFSRPFNLIASSVWNPFASFINSAATALGLGPLLPTGLSIPVFHKGGIVGDATGDSYDGSRSTTQDEVFALLQKGEGVMSKQMMANMTAAQISAFKKGEKRWWAVGGPYESGKGQAGTRIDSGYAYNSPDIPNFEQTKAFYEGTIKPLIGSVTTAYPGNLAANIGGTSMSRLGDAAVEYTRGYTDRMTEEQQKYLVQIGLPPDFDIDGALPAGFDLAEWRSFLGANKKPGSWPFIAAYLNAAGIPFLTNSTLRPGDVGSYHASGRAIDLGAPGDANYDSPGLLRINHALAPLLGVLAELIYSGPGGISDKAYDAGTMAQHHNHVHAALRDGGIVQDLVYAMLGEDGPEVVIPLNDPNRALSLARRSGLLRTLQGAQNRSTSYSPPSAVSDARSATTGGDDDGILGGAGNTYHIHGISWDQARKKIENRDRAALRRRR